MSVNLIPVKLPWIYPGAPLNFNGAPGNIQGNLTGMVPPQIQLNYHQASDDKGKQTSSYIKHSYNNSVMLMVCAGHLQPSGWLGPVSVYQEFPTNVFFTQLNTISNDLISCVIILLVTIWRLQWILLQILSYLSKNMFLLWLTPCTFVFMGLAYLMLVIYRGEKVLE